MSKVSPEGAPYAKDQTTKAAITGGPSANAIGYLGPNQIDRVSADGTTFKLSAFGLRMQDPAPGISEAAYFRRDPEGKLIGARREGHIRYSRKVGAFIVGSATVAGAAFGLLQLLQ